MHLAYKLRVWWWCIMHIRYVLHCNWQWRWWWFTTQPGFGNSSISSIAASSPWKIGIRLATIPSWSFEGDLEHLGDHVEKFQEVCWAPGSNHGFSWNLSIQNGWIVLLVCTHADALMTDHYWYYCGIQWRCRLMHVLLFMLIYVYPFSVPRACLNRYSSLPEAFQCGMDKVGCGMCDSAALQWLKWNKRNRARNARHIYNWQLTSQVFTLLTVGAFCSDWFLWIDSVCCLLAFLTGLMISLWRLLCVRHPNWIQELQVSGPKKDFKKYLEEIDFHGHKSALWAALDVKQDGYITVACQAYPTVFLCWEFDQMSQEGDNFFIIVIWFAY